MDWSELIVEALRWNIRWMSWNLFLAIIPLVLSVWLFRRHLSRSLFWWVGLLTFVAFLPNAPYVLTDIIHLVYDIRREPSIWVISLVYVPQYIAFMVAGFGAYVLSLINFGHYLNLQGQRRLVLFMEFFLHSLSAIGVYLGRFHRLNSWDFISQPDAVLNSTIDTLLARRPIMVIVVTFLIITVLYWVSKQVTLALVERVQNRQPRALLRPHTDLS